jgi:hypothetical protein
MPIRIKVVVTTRVLEQIKYLCAQISKVEWSGILYYEVDGTIKDPANMVCTLRDILPLHKGSGTYTEYDIGGLFVQHMMKNQELMDCNMAHIHSHNNMPTYFSGTDMSELNDNCPKYNYYLSFIVNNRMDFTCKIAMKAETQAIFREYSLKDDNGGYFPQVFNLPAREKMLVYDTNIVCENLFNVSEDFKAKTVDIIKGAERAKAAEAKRIAERSKAKPYQQNFSHSIKNKSTALTNMWDKAWDEPKTLSEALEEAGEIDEDQFLYDDKDIQDFVLKILTLDGDLQEHIGSEAELEEFFKSFIVSPDANWDTFAKEIVENLEDYLKLQFGDVEMEDRRDVLEDVVVYLENLDYEEYELIAAEITNFINETYP